jgi:hypothetical protein
LRSRTRWIASSLPLTPRAPKPGATRTPSTSSKRAEPFGFDALGVDALDVDRDVVVDAGVRDRLADRDVGVLELDVFPTSATLTRPLGFSMRSTIALQSSSCGGVSKRSLRIAISAKPSASRLSGT